MRKKNNTCLIVLSSFFVSFLDGGDCHDWNNLDCLFVEYFIVCI